MKLKKQLVLFSTVTLGCYLVAYTIAVRNLTFYYDLNSERVQVSVLVLHYLPWVIFIIYCLILAPLSLRGFDKKLRSCINWILSFMFFSLLSQLFISNWGSYFDASLMKWLFFIPIPFIVFLQGKIIILLNHINQSTLIRLKQFIKKGEVPFYNDKDIEKYKKFQHILYLVIFLLSDLSIKQIFLVCLILLLINTSILHFKILRKIKKNSKLVKKINRYGMVEAFIFMLIFVATIYNLTDMVLLLVLILNFKLYFLKELFLKIGFEDFVMKQSK